MSFQLIATYLIVLYALGYTAYHFLQLFAKKDSGCEGSCGECNFKNELRRRNVNVNPK